MEKTYQLTDFVSLHGNKISQSISQEGNIYRWLVTQGFGRAVIDGKRVVFRSVNGEISPSAFWQMEDAFQDFLEREGNNATDDLIKKGIILGIMDLGF